MNRPVPPASFWSDQIVKARRQEKVALACAAYLGDQPDNPLDTFAPELRRARYRAAMKEADAWSDYARQVEEAFQSAALAEMELADAAERRQRIDQAQAERRARYDAPQDAA